MRCPALFNGNINLWAWSWIGGTLFNTGFVLALFLIKQSVLSALSICELHLKIFYPPRCAASKQIGCLNHQKLRSFTCFLPFSVQDLTFINNWTSDHWQTVFSCLSWKRRTMLIAAICTMAGFVGLGALIACFAVTEKDMDGYWFSQHCSLFQIACAFCSLLPWDCNHDQLSDC